MINWILQFPENPHKITDIYILNPITFPPPQVKRGVATSLIDHAINICSDSYITDELNFNRDIRGKRTIQRFVNDFQTVTNRFKLVDQEMCLKIYVSMCLDFYSDGNFF